MNYDVLIAACLLHDIGRKEQFENPAVCHAIAGSEKAYQFLLTHGFEMGYAEQVKQCIQTHRFRKNNPPQSLEAKILFDADKLYQEVNSSHQSGTNELSRLLESQDN